MNYYAIHMNSYLLIYPIDIININYIDCLLIAYCLLPMAQNGGMGCHPGRHLALRPSVLWITLAILVV